MARAYTLTGDLRHQALMFLFGAPGLGKSVVGEVLFAIAHTYAYLIKESFLSKNGGEAKRFDMAEIIGKRLLFLDETQLGMSWDDTRMCKFASAAQLSAEIKFGRSVTFDNTGKIFVVGNHKPNIVAPETGGLPSRMLLTEAKGINYREPGNGGNEKLTRQIIDEEAPAILMWLIEQCVADYADPTLFSRLTADLKDASKDYAQEDNLIRIWGEQVMCVSPELEIDSLEAHKEFLEFAEAHKDRTYSHIKLSAFKEALQKAFPSIQTQKPGGKPLRRTAGENKGRRIIKGFGHARPEGGNIVAFPPHAPQPSTSNQQSKE
jgi:phage/plasmid-associated DNA primase